MVASGAGAPSQLARFVSVFGGVLGGTLLSLVFVPVLFVVVGRSPRRVAAWRGVRRSVLVVRDLVVRETAVRAFGLELRLRARGDAR